MTEKLTIELLEEEVQALDDFLGRVDTVKYDWDKMVRLMRPQ